MNDMWKRGILGVVVGDALGCPVQFESREEVANHPVTDMRGYGTFNLPEGSWTDDSSLTLALLDSINRTGEIDVIDVMDRFIEWLENGDYTPYGYSYDVGRGTMNAIRAFERMGDANLCGGRSERDNGNGSLMRILPACLFCIEKNLSDIEAVQIIHKVSSLTHAHIRSNISCGFYYFMAKAIVKEEGTLLERLQNGIDNGFTYYANNLGIKKYQNEMEHFYRLYDLNKFKHTHINDIRSSGYVVDSLEAAVWSLITTSSFKNALLTAVNLGDDTDTVGAIAGGLAGLFYGLNGHEGIPYSWINKIQRREWIIDMCDTSDMRIN